MKIDTLVAIAVVSENSLAPSVARLDRFMGSIIDLIEKQVNNHVP